MDRDLDRSHNGDADPNPVAHAGPDADAQPDLHWRRQRHDHDLFQYVGRVEWLDGDGHHRQHLVNLVGQRREHLDAIPGNGDQRHRVEYQHESDPHRNDERPGLGLEHRDNRRGKHDLRTELQRQRQQSVEQPEPDGHDDANSDIHRPRDGDNHDLCGRDVPGRRGLRRDRGHDHLNRLDGKHRPGRIKQHDDDILDDLDGQQRRVEPDEFLDLQSFRRLRPGMGSETIHGRARVERSARVRPGPSTISAAGSVAASCGEHGRGRRIVADFLHRRGRGCLRFRRQEEETGIALRVAELAE